MRSAAVVYREGHVSSWLPVAEKRITEMKAQLASMNKGRGSSRQRATGKPQQGQTQ
jgi:hypothetical protein